LKRSDVQDLRRVDIDEFIKRYNAASNAVRATQTRGGINRWPNAAELVCRFLDFTVDEGPLWSGLHGAVDGLDNEAERLSNFVRNSLNTFVDVEFELLVRRGLSEVDAAGITNGLRNGLLSYEPPTHSDVNQLFTNLQGLQGTVCKGVKWSVYGIPESEARRKVNAITIMTGGGGLVGTVADAAAALAMPLFIASIAGGMVTALGTFLGWKGRR